MTTVRRVPVLAIILGVVVLALSACGGSTGGGGGTGGGHEVDMGLSDFVQHAITIQHGDTVHLVDPSTTGGFHILCIGESGQCKPLPGAPAKLNTNDGMQVQAGDAPIDVVFATAGVYTIVCTVHSTMAVTITVN